MPGQGHAELASFEADVCNNAEPAGDSPASDLILAAHIGSSRVTAAGGLGSTVVVAKRRLFLP
jgi:hypothetical protein